MWFRVYGWMDRPGAYPLNMEDVCSDLLKVYKHYLYVMKTLFFFVGLTVFLPVYSPVLASGPTAFRGLFAGGPDNTTQVKEVLLGTRLARREWGDGRQSRFWESGTHKPSLHS